MMRHRDSDYEAQAAGLLLALIAIGELVSNKPVVCAILAASWWVNGDGQCRDEAQ